MTYFLGHIYFTTVYKLDTQVYGNEQLGPCFYVLVHYSLLLSSAITLKQLFASGLVNTVE